VETAPAERQSVSQFVSAEAVVFPLKQATVSPKITSTIADFKVQRGSRVKKGQLLAILENKDLAAQAEASQGDFEQADANYAITVNAGVPQQIQKAELDAAAAKSAFEAAQKVFDSRKDLYQQGAIPRRDLDSADVALAQARSQNEQAQKQLGDLQRMGKEQLLKAAEGTKASAEGHYRAATAQLSYSEIRSPIDGVVTERPLYVGDLATANQPILTVMDVSALVAKAHIPQVDATQLKLGDAAQIKVEGEDEPVAGRVSLVSPALDPGSTTVEVWIETRKPSAYLKPGMTVNIEITAKTIKDAIAVPSDAIFKNAEGASYVVVAGTDRKAHQKVVELGVRNSELTQITSGIHAGDPIVISGGYAVPDGTAIEIEKPSGDKDEKKQPSAQPEKDKD
jgi:HlyD family secretion protein